MRHIADLHMHSKYSRAVSKNMDLAHIEKYAKIKGINLMGTGDFTHPKWIAELKENLKDNGEGIFLTKDGFQFLLTTEISLIYTDGKGRRIHNVVLAPSFEIVDQITEYLLKHGRVDYDGRPIFKIPCPEFVQDLRNISQDIEIIPAHIWTPHFSLFGEYNQFSTVKECFKEQTKHIHAMETGLSSNPSMNWRLSQLDNFNLVSFSDSHGFWPWRLGREATLFDVEPSFQSIIKALRTKQGLAGTIEVDPCFGKYHFTGHRDCEVSMAPADSKKAGQLCPKCGKKMIIGVLERVEELADREEGFKPKDAKPYYSLIPLSEILATVLSIGVSSKKVWAAYNKLVDKGRSEFDILLNLEHKELEQLTDRKIADIILKNRAGQIKIKPGYDGLYGVPIMETDSND